jgi:hypothetical protein
VAEGVPEHVARVPESFTGRYLAPLLRWRIGDAGPERSCRVSGGVVEGSELVVAGSFTGRYLAPLLRERDAVHEGVGLSLWRRNIPAEAVS